MERRDEAERLAHEALELVQRIGERMTAVYLLALLARIAAEAGRLERAGVPCALEAEEQRGVVGQWEAERETYAAPVLAHAGSDFDRGLETGRGLPFEAAIDRALSDSRVASV